MIISFVGRSLPWFSLVDSGFSGPRSTRDGLRLIDCRYGFNSFESGLVGFLGPFGSGRLIGRWDPVGVGCPFCLPAAQAVIAWPHEAGSQMCRFACAPSARDATACRPAPARCVAILNSAAAEIELSRGKCHARSAAISRRTGEFLNRVAAALHSRHPGVRRGMVAGLQKRSMPVGVVSLRNRTLRRPALQLLDRAEFRLFPLAFRNVGVHVRHMVLRRRRRGAGPMPRGDLVNLLSVMHEPADVLAWIGVMEAVAPRASRSTPRSASINFQ
jgi:hypothetical protein